MTVGPHLSTDTISDFLEGLLPDAESQAAEEHLAGCAECSSTRDALVQVQDVLTSTPAAPPMPEHVAARIEESLAGEVQARAATAGETASGTATRGEVASEPAPKRGLLERLGLVGPGGRAFKVLAAAAALCVIGGAGAVAYRLTQDGPGDASAPTAAQEAKPSDQDGSGQDGSENKLVGPSMDSKEFGADAGRYSDGEQRRQQAGAPEDDAGDTMTDLVFQAPKASAAQRECASGAVSDAGGEQVERAYQASLDGEQVVVAITENGDASDGKGLAYAVSGCPSSPKIAQKSTVSLK